MIDSELSSPSDDENDGKKTDSDGKEKYDVNSLPNLFEEASRTEGWETCSRGLYYSIIFFIS